MPILSQHHVARYQIGDRIGTTASSHLYRVQAIENGVPNVLKRLHPDNFTVEQAAHFRREYGILQSLDLPGVVKPIALVDDAEHPTMVLGNVFGEFLEDVLARRRLDLATCLEWACELASILAGLHAAHLVHQDLRPVNLMVTADQRICVLDLNMATADVPQTPTANHPLGGDWAYRSPEQTGRLNRKVDCRTDFYSLGITLYRMLTGRLPFHGNDALEWAHCHIARLPRPPDELCPDIPPMVSAIVLKLLAKMPEDRYQSTHGLLFDLHACQTQWEMRGAITPFAPGTHDVSERFQLSPKLVGREAEVEQLLASFQAMVATEHTALLLICGGAGIGKSALVHELRQPILRHGGYFISGKFDQYQREIPYATVTQAFHELVQQILAEDEGRIVVWSQQIQAAVGVNGRLIVDVLPQVELIIGPQNPVPELHPAEAQNRFHMVFQQFLGVFARQAHPLTLFLDDLQWADSASLRLLRELVISADKRFLLVVGAYRDNEVGPMHPLTLTLDSLRKDGVIFEQLFLSPLSLTDVARILENTFHCCPKRAEPLAQLLREKTAGNPFFTIQFLGALSEEGLLEFDAKAGEWIWDLKYIRAKDYTDNVVDLMLGKLRRLPDNTQQALKLLACLGSKAPFSRLMMVHGGSEEALHADLSDAVTGGLVLCEDGAYKFLHDRFQEAAYSLIPESKRASLHIEIGRQLYAQTPAGELIEKIFEVLDHLDRGATLLTSPKERKRVAELNLIAAKRAKGLAAYTSEQKYLAAGVALLEKDKWDRQYDLAFAFDLERAECEYLCGRFDNADALFQQTLAQARSQLDRARVMTAQMDLDQIAGRCSEGVTRGLNILSSFGMIFPKTDEAIAEETTAALDELARALAERSLDSQLDTPLLTDPEHRAIVRVLCAMLPLTYLSQPSLMPLMVLRMVKFCINHGNTEETCFGYLVYAMVLAGVYRDYAQAIEVSMFAIRLNEKFRDPRWKGPILHGHANHMLFWRQHFRHSVPVLEQAFAACIAAGDLNQASYLAFEAVWQAVERGEELDEVYRISERYAAFARQAKNEAVHQTIRIQQQFVRCLKGLTHADAPLDDEYFSTEAFLATVNNANFVSGSAFYRIIRLVLLYTYGRYEEARAAATAAREVLDAVLCLPIDATFHFYEALTLLACCGGTAVAQAGKNIEKLAHWARNCPENFENRYALVSAELARVEGRDMEAMRLYDQAIASARENGFIQNESLANEVAARFYLERGFETIAQLYLGNARSGYLRWGADGKVAQLGERYPQLRAQLTLTPAASLGDEAVQLDVLSVAKASQAISGHIVLNELADTLLQIVLENAGAQTGSLLVFTNEGVRLAAHARVEQAAVHVQVCDGQATLDATLPAAILNYVRRSREQVLLPDVAQPHPFSADPYFADCHPKSVLCLPILLQEKLSGLLYLENNLVTYAFAPERVAVLKLLACQAAISLENAQLYTNLLQEKVRFRRLVDANIIGVFFWDLSGDIHDANDAFLQLSGYSRQDMHSGRLRWADLTPPEYNAMDEHATMELDETGSCTPYEKEFMRRDGSRVPVLLGAALFEGSQEHGVAFVLDVTERKRAEAALRRAYEELDIKVSERTRELNRSTQELARSNAELEQLAYVASHDLQEPLRMVTNYLQLVEERYQGLLDADGHEFIGFAVDGAKRMHALINDLLTYSRVNSKSQSSRRVDCAVVVEAVESNLSKVIEEAGAKITYGPLPIVLGGATQLIQLFQNLIANAIKFHRDQPPEVHISAEADGEYWRFSVQDNGIGIAPEYFERIFVMFQRLHSRRAYAGTGIGLAICKKIVEHHGGRIWVEANAQGGSIFRFTLQAAKEDGK